MLMSQKEVYICTCFSTQGCTREGAGRRVQQARRRGPWRH